MRVLIDVTDPKTQMKLQLLPLDRDDEAIDQLGLYEGHRFPYILMDFTDTMMIYVDKVCGSHSSVGTVPELLL